MCDTDWKIDIFYPRMKINHINKFFPTTQRGIFSRSRENDLKNCGQAPRLPNLSLDRVDTNRFSRHFHICLTRLANNDCSALSFQKGRLPNMERFGRKNFLWAPPLDLRFPFPTVIRNGNKNHFPLEQCFSTFLIHFTPLKNNSQLFTPTTTNHHIIEN